jgi:uncharacterized repeat protein (TIGR02543 family)
VTIYAGWVPVSYAVTFETGNDIDGTISFNMNYESTLYVAPVLSVWPDHEFMGWYLDSNFNQPATFPASVTGATAFYAKWKVVYSITYMWSGSVQKVEKYDAGTAFNVWLPTRSGYGFGGWYTDVSLTNRYVQAPAVGSITLYARWDTSYYRFRAVVVPQKTELDYYIAATALMYKLPTPSMLGWIFSGWYTDAGIFENEYDFNAPVMSDVTIYAKWIEDIVKVTIDCPEKGSYGIAGFKPIIVEVQRGKLLVLDDDPERDGFIYDGLFTDKACTIVYDMNAPVMSAMTLYVKWAEIPPPASNDVLDGVTDGINAAKAFFKKNVLWLGLGSGGLMAISILGFVLKMKKG